MSALDMAAYLLARIAEDERVARAACSRDDVAEHWQWVTVDTDQVVPDGGLEKAVEEQGLSLRSVETHPSEFVGPLPNFIIWRVDEYAAAEPHIARHDPARVIAECEAKRRVVEHCQEVLLHHVHGDWDAIDLAREVLHYLVLVHADRPDFPPEWVAG